MASEAILIIGASQAGAQLAISLRELGVSAPVTLVGAEQHLPYRRPPLSKTFLAGRDQVDALLLRPPEFYTDREIDVVTGEWIAEVDLGSAGGIATGASGRHFEFSQLALTVGGTPRRLTVPGADLTNVLYLRDVADAVALRGSIAAAERVVVVGGGFLGLEAAAVASAGGAEVVVVEALDQLMGRAVAPVVSDFYVEAHRRRGVEVKLGTAVVALSGEDTVSSVELSDGSCLAADLVLVAIGIVPHTELAEALDLEVAGGIVIDGLGRTSRDGVVAAGDCTTMRSAGGLRRIESVANAIDQARAAAATLAGVPDPLAAVPWFWSDQGDLKLQTAGLSTGFDDVVLRGDLRREQFAALYYREGVLIAIDAVNSPRDYMAVRKILERGGTVPPAAAADAAVALRDFSPA